jgi:dihydroflavonol-4-reductase
MSNGRLVFITGATGFIGRRLVRGLIARGDRLRCLVRSAERASELSDLGADLIVGEITDQAALERGMRGCALAYHLAAIYDIGVVDAGALERANVGGTMAFLAALEASNPTRGVYVSTTVALGPTGREPSDRLVEHAGPYPSEYHRTKSIAHRWAREAQARGLPLIIVCPAFVYGPGDQGPGGRFIADLLARRVPALLSAPGWFSYVHVDDVVAGLVQIGERGAVGSTYVLSGEPASLNDFAERVAAEGGVRPPRLRFPVQLASAAGTVLDAVARLTGLRFPITREAVATTAKDNWLHSHAAATRDFGWQPRTLDQGLRETIAWFKARGK